MSQLIALIIAIALGAIVTAIGFVFLGDAFTKNSERGVALQLVSQASQIEMAMTAHRAEQAKSAYTAATPTSSPSGDWSATSATLVTLGYLKDTVVAPQGAYNILKDGKSVYLVAREGTVEISANVCKEVEKLAGENDTLEPLALTADAAAITTALVAKVYKCFSDGASTPKHTFVYQVE